MSVRVISIFAALLSLNLCGCAVVAVADAAVTVAATAVKVTADVVGAGVHAAASGVKAITKDKDSDEKKK